MENQPRQVRLRHEPAHPIDQANRHPRSWWRKLARFVMTAVVICLCGVLAYGLYLGSLVLGVTSKPLNLAGLTRDTDGRTNVLVLGVGDPGHAGENLSDTIMLMSINSKLGRAAEVSIPRDLRVSIPGHGTGKINAAHSYGGEPLARGVVSTTTNQTIDYSITTNFSGVKAVVDVVGGLDVDVTDELRDSAYPCDDDQYRACGLDIKPGLQHMNGSQVLGYVRCRKGTCGNDFGRAQRQQEVIGLLKAKLARPEFWLNPAKLAAMSSVVRQYIVTDMSSVQLLEFAWKWNQYTRIHEPVRLVLSTDKDGLLTGASGSSDLVPAAGDFSVVQRRIAELVGQ